jgi:Bifunctional DNA primase/polymerase, N-terminal
VDDGWLGESEEEYEAAHKPIGPVVATERPSPYERTARVYLERGYDPLPLPAGRKHPPPKGFTGYGGALVTERDVARWLRLGPFGNIALRAPEGVVGIDVDAYHDGLVTLADLEEAHGKLPPSWTSTSRTDGSSVRLYRCPVPLPGVLGAGIEVVQHHHRYLVAPPSRHPEGRRYRWSHPDGRPVRYPPTPDRLPALPEAWNALAAAMRGAVAPAAVDDDMDEFLRRHDSGRHHDAYDSVAKGLDAPGARHDRLVAAAGMIARDAYRGRYSARWGLERLHEWWDEVMDEPARRDGREFSDAIAWAVGQVLADPPAEWEPWGPGLADRRTRMKHWWDDRRRNGPWWRDD